LSETRVDHFDDLRNKVDVCVETFIANHYSDTLKETQINQIRIEWLNEIDECEQLNLAELEHRKDKHNKLNDEVLFKKFMFDFEVSEGEELINLRLVVIDAYLSSGKVECFQILMKVVNRHLTHGNFQKTCMQKLFVNININHDVNNCLIKYQVL
jgi:hypothetical protein